MHHSSGNSWFLKLAHGRGLGSAGMDQERIVSCNPDAACQSSNYLSRLVAWQLPCTQPSIELQQFKCSTHFASASSRLVAGCHCSTACINLYGCLMVQQVHILFDGLVVICADYLLVSPAIDLALPLIVLHTSAMNSQGD